MLGTIVNNKQLLELERAKRITIRPFDQMRIKTIHYPLHISRFYECGPRDGNAPTDTFKAEFSKTCNSFEFDPGEYLLATVKEHMSLDDGIVGHFVPSSKLIDYGFDLTCGRLEAPYGQNGEVIRFGMANKLPRANKWLAEEVVAYIYFIDLRALSNFKVELAPEERELFDRWKRRSKYADESGVHPENDGR